MYPTWYPFGLEVSLYWALYGVAIAAGSAIFVALGALRGARYAHLVVVSITAAGIGVVGARAFHYWLHPEQWTGISDALDISNGGMVFYGGAVAGLGAMLLACRCGAVQWSIACDAFAVAAPVGVAIGRLACFAQGCCFGVISTAPWAVEYRQQFNSEGRLVGSPALFAHIRDHLIEPSACVSAPVHPVQAYEMVISLLLFGVLCFMWRARVLEGSLLVVYGVAYSAYRFCLEFLRTEPRLLWNLTSAQLTGAGLIVVIVACWLLRPTVVRPLGHPRRALGG